ncbi:hypothetical protein Pmi06nite_25170 [Planotetraspora mira]|uniref:Uncharacterized protein n=2 Tax=Planotetraspora mira TaxID=58121 RepID=A0A8J3X608_9ACTN|nr:hypothetical protein Pmi06nite_25170 [Planotetraspora mira]
MSSGSMEPEDGDDGPADKPLPPLKTTPSEDSSPDALAAKAPARKGRRLSWEAVGGITAIAGVVAAVVFGVLQVVAPTESSEPSPGVSAVPADERLELVGMQASRDPVAVPVRSISDGDVSTVPTGGETEERRALVVTLRNSDQDPAILTGVKLVVHSTLRPIGCGPGEGDAVLPSLAYDFRFPATLSEPWTHVDPQVFEVAPHEADALSITMGPEKGAGMSLMWRFSVYGVSKGGKEAYWGDGVWTDYYEASEADYARYVRGESPKPIDDEVRSCAAGVLRGLKSFTADSSLIVHPGVTAMIDYYQRLAQS